MPTETREPFTFGHERIDAHCECSQCAPYNDPDVIEERHEFHLVQGWLGYCTCGWVCDRPTDRLYAWRDIADSWRVHARWYRDHPEVCSFQ